ncbi:transcriptional regulator, TetR family [Paenibacillus polysaccharolyticus]|uniref:Transcriptional regulator, TetR family n=1 Tax=Paenibacillus polysaccharolyticus TaxID=582692 RepID=A0A1G5CCX9_9BACL|nr:TetR/AcrR family transcriptional regulator [Paenibacillus polysaccharolyticus]SCY00170.1 transcriptional regulator, TetR family [Paenibacillus polysaccharolyticus]
MSLVQHFITEYLSARQQTLKSCSMLTEVHVATMDDLCALTQMNKGNLYHHFKNKEVLFLQLLTQHTEQMSQKWLRLMEHTSSPSEQLLEMADLFGRDCESPLIQALEESSRTLSSESVN